jgi:hypothetical protein
VVSVTPWPHFTPEKGPPVPTDRRISGPLELDWKQRLEENSFASARNKTHLIHSDIILTELPPATTQVTVATLMNFKYVWMKVKIVNSFDKKYMKYSVIILRHLFLNILKLV